MRGDFEPGTGAELVVVVDVLRAFTTTAIAFERGVRRVFLAASVEEARALRDRLGGGLLAGEVRGLPVPGFDLGNSPAELFRRDLAGETLVLRTTNGVRALLGVPEATPVLAAGLRDAGDVARRLADRGARRVQIVASSHDGDEDLACAELLRARVLGHATPSPEQVAGRVRSSAAAAKFLDPAREAFDPDDLRLCAAERETGFVQERIRGADATLRLEWRHA